jgi:hypothetical protein
MQYYIYIYIYHQLETQRCITSICIYCNEVFRKKMEYLGTQRGYYGVLNSKRGLPVLTKIFVVFLNLCVRMPG